MPDLGAAIVLEELLHGYDGGLHGAQPAVDTAVEILGAISRAATAAWGSFASDAWCGARMFEAADTSRKGISDEGCLDDARAAVTAALAGMSTVALDCVQMLVDTAADEADATTSVDDLVVWALCECASTLAAAACDAECYSDFVAALRV